VRFEYKPGMQPHASRLAPAAIGSAGRRSLIFAALGFALLLALVWQAPIAQPDSYHAFADSRTLLGVPHFWNVVSNLAFLAAGCAGLALLRRSPGRFAIGWWPVFAGTALVTLGSSIYHLEPDDASLVWDRLTMAVAFAGLLSALVGEFADPRHGRVLLLPALAFALLAIAWWRIIGDLSLWIWVQVAPLVIMLLVALIYERGSRDARYLLLALPWYVAAKLFETGDATIFAWSGGTMGGHALKHLAAAFGVATLCLMLRARRAAAP
jgi:hypothetical protein